MLYITLAFGALSSLLGWLLTCSYKKNGALKAKLEESDNKLIDLQKSNDNLRRSLKDVQDISNKPVSDSVSSALDSMPTRS